MEPVKSSTTSTPPKRPFCRTTREGFEPPVDMAEVYPSRLTTSCSSVVVVGLWGGLGHRRRAHSYLLVPNDSGAGAGNLSDADDGRGGGARAELGEFGLDTLQARGEGAHLGEKR